MSTFFGVTLVDGRHVALPVEDIRYIEKIRGHSTQLRLYIKTDKWMRYVDIKVSSYMNFLFDLNMIAGRTVTTL
jgi:hypothetical protein